MMGDIQPNGRDIYSEYQTLKQLAATATKEYDTLFQDFTELHQQYEELKKISTETEERLKSSEKANEERIRTLEENLAAAENARNETENKQQNQCSKCQRLRQELTKSNEKVTNYDSMLHNLSRYSTLVLDEFVEVKESYEKELVLKQAAERYASELKVQRDASVRQSSVLLLNVSADTKLMQAMLEIERLTKQLDQELKIRDEKIKSLEETLEMSGEYKNIQQLEEKLELSSIEMERMKNEMEELERNKTEIEAENIHLRQRLSGSSSDGADLENFSIPPPPSMFAPPPPPVAPLPPPVPPCPTKVVLKSRSRLESDLETPQNPAESKQATIHDAMKEMMERIQSGKLLSPGVSQKKISTSKIFAADSSKQTAMEDLTQLLAKLKDKREGRPSVSEESPSTSSTIASPRFNTQTSLTAKSAPKKPPVPLPTVPESSANPGRANKASESNELQQAFNKIKSRPTKESESRPADQSKNEQILKMNNASSSAEHSTNL